MPVKKKPARKTAAKKTTARKGAAKKKTAKKATTRKTTAKKTAKKTTRKTTAKKAAPKKAAKPKTKRKPNAAFMKPMMPSGALSEVIGAKPMPRTEVTKKLWAYIKKNNLQDAKKRTMINADDKLKAIFGGKGQVSMFEMTKLVSKHLKAA
jgi:chromatin remodeling complex protein RSC6